MKQRSASERINAVNDNYNIDRAHRNADYGLIRLTLANIAHHAVIRYKERGENPCPTDTLNQILKEVLHEPVPACTAPG